MENLKKKGEQRKFQKNGRYGIIFKLLQKKDNFNESLQNKKGISRKIQNNF